MIYFNYRLTLFIRQAFVKRLAHLMKVIYRGLDGRAGYPNDVFARRNVGWPVSSAMRPDFVLDALM